MDNLKQLEREVELLGEKLTIDENNEISINFKPSYDISFWKDEQQVGIIEWNDGMMKFSGDMEESAKTFFDFLKPYVDSYIQNKLNGR